MSRIFDVKIEQGLKDSLFDIYYDSIDPSNIATISSSNQPAEDITYTDLVAPNGVRVVVPDSIQSIIINDQDITCPSLFNYVVPSSNTASYSGPINSYGDCSHLYGFDSTLNDPDTYSNCLEYSYGDDFDLDSTIKYIDCNGDLQTITITAGSYQSDTFCASSILEIGSVNLSTIGICRRNNIYENFISSKPTPNSTLKTIGGRVVRVLQQDDTDTGLYLYKFLVKENVSYSLSSLFTDNNLNNNTVFSYTLNGVSQPNVTVSKGNTTSIAADCGSVEIVSGDGVINQNSNSSTQYIHKLVFYAEGDKFNTTPTANFKITRPDLSTSGNQNIVISGSATSTSLNGGALIEFNLTGETTASLDPTKSFKIDYTFIS